MSIYIGIDPGVKGGLALIDASSSMMTVSACSMPTTFKEIWDWFRSSPNPKVFAIIEKVGGYVGSPQPGSAMFKFGCSVGFLKGCLVASYVPFEEVSPQKWQKGLGIPPRKDTESKGQWKNRLKGKASELFPHLKVTLQTADALLLAEYCRRKRTGTL